MSALINYPNIVSSVFNTPLYAMPDLSASIKSFLINKMIGNDRMETEEGTSNRVDYNIVGNLAIIPIHGSLMSRRGSIDAACMEIESYERVRSRISQALGDDRVSAIVLDVNSGGGMAIGCKETADFIYENRDSKPIYGIANFIAGSAAYFLLSACTRIFTSETSIIGSIGVIWEHWDYSKMLEDSGIKVTTFYRGDNKADCSPIEALTEQAANEVNERLDFSYKQFTESVSKYRGLSVENVVRTNAKIYQGTDAITVGLADELLTPQQAINAISQTHPMMIETEQRFAVQAKAMQMNSQL